MKLISNLSMPAKKRIKIIVVSVLSLLNAYVIYGIIGNIVVWYMQPRFTLPDGSTTASLGFFVQFVIYIGIFLITASLLLVTLFFFFKKTKNKRKKTESI